MNSIKSQFEEHKQKNEELKLIKNYMEMNKKCDKLLAEKKDLIQTVEGMKERNINLKNKMQEKSSECESLSLRISYLAEKEKQEMNMFGQYRAPVEGNGPGVISEKEELEEISDALERKNKVIEEEFRVLRQKFLEAAECKMEDMKQNDGILQEIEKIREMYLDLKNKNNDLRSQVEILNRKLDSKNKLNEHLEEKCANILIEKEDMIIRLKAEIVAIKKKLDNSSKGKFKPDIF